MKRSDSNSPSRSSSGRPRRTGSRSEGKSRPHPLSPSRGDARKKRRPVGEARRNAGSLFARPDITRRPETKRNTETAPAEGHRVQKILAAAGYGSRRECEELITSGRVEIDGQIVTELGVRADPLTQKIRVDGESLPKTRPVYLAVNKPKGFLCTHRDQQGRRRVIDLVPDSFGRVFPIGRLDQYSEGLILLTNDGAFAEQLAHPRFEVPKKYQVQVAGEVDADLAHKLQKGIHIAEGVVQADEVKVKSHHPLNSVLEIVLREGKNREIRRMLARIGHKVLTLRRIAIGPVKLGDLAPGEYRLLTKQEVASLYGAGRVK